MQLYEALAAKVTEWRKQNYPHDKYPAIGEILELAQQPATTVKDSGEHFLTRPRECKLLKHSHARRISVSLSEPALRMPEIQSVFKWRHAGAPHHISYEENFGCQL